MEADDTLTGFKHPKHNKYIEWGYFLPTSLIYSDDEMSDRRLINQTSHIILINFTGVEMMTYYPGV